MTVTENPYAADFEKLNQDALFLFREMVRHDKVEASLMLGLEKDAADAIEQATLDDIRMIAKTGVLLFRARFGETRFWTDMVAAARHGDDQSIDVARLQAILYAAEER